MRDAIYAEINAERARQEAKFPGRTPAHDIGDLLKLAVLHEESGEVANALIEGDREGLRKELVQVAAVCVAWLEAMPAGDDGTGEA
jgi:NTP pyrophosphatase (non-canonical NTP hydrolase)